jgi:glutamine synthetase
LSEAVDELERDSVLMDALGPEFGPEYIKVKRAEWKAYHDSVSAWEMENYLGVY